MNSQFDAVEVGSGLRYFLETELSKSYFVTFYFQKLSRFCPMLLLLDFIKSLSSRVAFLTFSRTLILGSAVLRALTKLAEYERMELNRSLIFFSELSFEACETWKFSAFVQIKSNFLNSVIVVTTLVVLWLVTRHCSERKRVLYVNEKNRLKRVFPT